MFRSLRARNFRLFATGQVISNSGTWMQRVAQDWLVLDLTHGSGTAVGIATGLQFLPLLLFSLWGGMIADRYPKRQVLLVTQATMGALAAILGVLDVTGVVRPWQVYLLAFGLGLATVVDNPTRQSFAIEMVGRADLPNAIALNSGIFNLGRILGPAAAGLVISAVGTSTAFFLNAASYLAVIAGLRMMRPAELRPAEPVARAKGQVRDGLRYVWRRPDLLMTMVLVFFIATFGMNFQVTTALMSRLVYHTGAGRFGLASSVFALGALIGALGAARRSVSSGGDPRSPRARTGTRTMIAAALAFGVLEVATGLMPTYWAFLVLLVPTGAAVIRFTTMANASVQLTTAAAMRGRVMGIYMLVFLGGAPAGAPLTGLIAEDFGTRIALIGGGFISVVAAAAVAAILMRRRNTQGRENARAEATTIAALKIDAELLNTAVSRSASILAGLLTVRREAVRGAGTADRSTSRAGRSPCPAAIRLAGAPLGQRRAVARHASVPR